MGIRRKVIKIDHIKTKTKITECKICENCPSKLYTDTENIKLGVGNIISNTIFILPTYSDTIKEGYETMLSVLIKEFKEITGYDLLTYAYVTRLVKCYSNSTYNLYINSVSFCSNCLFEELNKVNRFQNIVFFGSSLKDLTEHNELLVEAIKANFNIITIPNPLVSFYKPSKYYNEFVDKLKSIVNDNF